MQRTVVFHSTNPFRSAEFVPAEMVVSTELVAASITEALLRDWFATKARVPCGLTARPCGEVPMATEVNTALVEVSSTQLCRNFVATRAIRSPLITGHSAAAGVLQRAVLGRLFRPA